MGRFTGKRRAVVLGLMSLLGPLVLAQDPVLEELARQLPPGIGPHTLSSQQAEILLDLAANRGWNVFDLLNEGIPFLVRSQKRLRITGEDLRQAARRFRLGDSRVDAVLPLPKIEEIQIGLPTREGEGQAEVILNQPHRQFLELGEFTLETRYGFRRVVGKSLAEAFGISVRNGPFSFAMSHIERVPDPTGGNSPNFIAIHLHLFFRPKRWHIDPVRRLP